MKNRRDLCLRKIEKNDLSMRDTRKRLQETLDELERREKERTDSLKDKLFEIAMPYFGNNISEDELEDWFKKIMDADRNKGAVVTLKRLEEERVRKIAAEDAARFEKLKENHKTLFSDSKKAAKEEIDSAGSDSDDIDDEDSSVSEAKIDMEEPSGSDADYYTTNPEELDRMPEDIDSDDSET
ncbi:MAG: hypothetical protein IJJ76_04165 [Ruminococcus sp.]|uniref:hypothetical protein n=1 Tax=Ruminococcus sp. TaxID=41978 RepID=UPI0025FF89EE|nr:hypothetical protein [Ruminococcus sp.]MBR0528940.1 hypothetical protein [Ruminococcus sp.]